MSWSLQVTRTLLPSSGSPLVASWPYKDAVTHLKIHNNSFVKHVLLIAEQGHQLIEENANIVTHFHVWV